MKKRKKYEKTEKSHLIVCFFCRSWRVLPEKATVYGKRI